MGGMIASIGNRRFGKCLYAGVLVGLYVFKRNEV